MAAIVYEGMVGGEGELFAGMKFYVLHRVPMRQTFMDAITNNGGELVKLDNQADIVIADHARKTECPVGSVSWKFIDKSVARGRLENIEDYRAGPTTHTVREVGSAQPPRSGRTPFTAEDDRDLLLWVTKAERNGISLKGNEIYKQFEEINPRHTFQSWRDHWIKRLSHRPRPEISEEELSAVGNPTGSKYSNHLPSARQRRSPTPDDEDDSAAPVEQEVEARPQSSVSRSNIAKPKPPAPKASAIEANDKPVAAQSIKIVPLVRKSSGGMNFTQAETEHMMEYYDIMAEADQKSGVKAWAKYSVENPSHSAREWHDYFVQTIKPRMEKRRQKSNAVTSSTTSEASASRRAYIGTSQGKEAQYPPSQPIQADRQRFVDPSTTDEKIFIEELSAMTEENESEVNFEPIVCGRKIPLFRLWQVVNSEEFGGYGEVLAGGLWSQVAKKLNFNEFKHADAPEAIKSAYEVILPQFEAAREEYLAGLEDEAMIESQLRATAERDSMEEEVTDEGLEIVEEEEEEEDDYDDDLEAPASVPRQPQPSSSSKRTFESGHMVNQGSSPLLGSSNKRQRIDKGKGNEREIPSTPEDLTNPNQTPRPTYKPSPLKYQQSVIEEDSGSDEIFTSPVKAPNLPRKQLAKRNLGPETQDFNFPPVNEDVESQSSPPSLPNRRKEMKIIAAGDSSPREGSSTQSQTASQKEEQLMAFIDQHVALGYSQDIVIQALESTTMMTGNAAIVMEALSSGKGIPEDIQGVWTAADDVALEDVESEDFKRVAMKHGTKFVALRQKFLEEQREARREFGTE